MFKTWTGGDQPMTPMTSPQASGAGGVTAPGGWHPTILYMLALVAAEIILVGFLTRNLLK